jgi:hypothetical protein
MYLVDWKEYYLPAGKVHVPHRLATFVLWALGILGDTHISARILGKSSHPHPNLYPLADIHWR